MTIMPEAEKQIGDFFASVEAKHITGAGTQFCYLAVKTEGQFRIVQARLLFNSIRPKAQSPTFSSENIRAGVCSLEELDLTPRQLAENLLEGHIDTPHGELFFVGNDTGTFGARYDPLHPDGLKTQLRFEILLLMGGRNDELMRGQMLDWELKASETPYDSIQDLAFDYYVSEIRDFCNVEFVLLNLAAFDFTSTVVGEKATIAALLTTGLPTKEMTVGYRVFSGGNIVKRSRINGNDMQWTQTSERQRGSVEIDVPKAAVLNCVVSFAGVAQHHGWVGDPAAMQNPRRAVYEVFDPKLESLNDIITKAHTRGRDARDLEAGIAWLLWMLGFSAAHIGGLPRTQQDFADLIVATPAGHFVVVECTTGLLKANNKLPLLVQRTELVRQALVASNNQHLRALPVLVTSKARSEIVADIEQAERLGVLVATAETLAQGLERTALLPNADTMFTEFEAAATAALAKYN